MNDAFHTYLTDKPNCTLKFKLTNVTEIIDIINKTNSSSGVDDLSNKVIKHIHIFFQIIDLYPYCLQYQKYLKSLFLTKCLNTLRMMI